MVGFSELHIPDASTCAATVATSIAMHELGSARVSEAPGSTTRR